MGFWQAPLRIKGVILLCAGLLLNTAVYALEFSFTGGAGNLFFDTEAEKPIGDGEFTGTVQPLGKLSVSDQVSTMFSFAISVERDPLLRNLIYGEIGIESEILTCSIGPLFGIFNSQQNFIRPGFSAGISLNFPGIIFINLNAGATLGSLKAEGDYTLETSGISLGFWLPNLFNTISMNSKKFSMVQANDIYAEDELLRFRYRAELHSKSFPYLIYLDMGYQTLSRSYDGPGVSGEDHFRSVFLGFEAALTIRPLFTILFGAEMPVYAWGKSPLSRGERAWFYRAFAGFVWAFEKKEA